MPKVVSDNPASSARPHRYPGDPKPRTDGRCLVDRKPRPPVAVRHDDPFCSADCCRRFYRTPAGGPVKPGPKVPA